MATDWLVLDCPNLAWRAYHAHKNLEWNGEQTGVIFGVMNDLRTLADRFNSTNFVFCFDVGKGLREQKFPAYKASRRIERFPEEEAQRREGVRYQIDKLRTDYLPGLGYKNVFWQSGYEADDVMASVALNTPEEDRVILVSGDEDLYQLLNYRVAVYHPKPKELVTARVFKAEYGIHPEEWVKVKALAGCGTDDVEGVEGVGEKTAIAWFTHKPLRQKGLEARINKFVRSGRWGENMLMVTLPYPGTKAFRPESDEGKDPAAWDLLCDRLGIRSLAGRQPDGLRQPTILGID